MYTTPITTPALIAAFADSICGDKDHADPDFDRLPNDACTYPKVVLVNDDGTFAFVHFKPSMNLDAIIYNPPNSTTIEIARRERAKEAGMKTEEYEGESKAVWRAKIAAAKNAREPRAFGSGRVYTTEKDKASPFPVTTR